MWYKVSRGSVAMAFVILDSSQIAVTMIFLLYMRKKVRREVNDVENSLMEVQDFTVQITNLP
jgi:hypothetical protein